MSYSRTTWQNGDTITANKLNNIETGILGNESDISDLNTNLSGDINYIVDNVFDTENLLLNAPIKFGKTYYSGEEHDMSQYSYAVIPVESGHTYIVQSQTRFITYAFGDPVATYTPANYQFTPASSGNAYFTLYNDTDTHGEWAIYESSTVKDVGSYQHPNTASNMINNVVGVLEKKNGTLSKTHALMTAGNILTLSNIQSKKNYRIVFSGDIFNLSLIEVGKGRSKYTGATIEITPTTYTVNKFLPGKEQVVTGSHGLTLDTFLKVIIDVKELSADIIIMTKGGSYTINNVYWDGSQGEPIMVVNYAYESQYVQNATLSFFNSDYDKDIYLFGDSFISLGTNQRWVYYAMDKGFDSWYLDGFGGRGSSDAIVSFRAAMSIGRPKRVIWALGMNDADSSSAINATWKTCVDEVIDYCDTNCIELILATIPCTPTQRNEYKNNYIKSSGYKYIDFATAVNGLQYGDTWYDGYLSSDNVHPTALGAEALAYQAFTDLPEIMHR